MDFIRGLKIFLIVVVVGVLVSFTDPYAFGWGNGDSHGNGYGTHDWILDEANRVAGLESKGGSWVDLKVALPVTDDPDTVSKDFVYHVYDVWGVKYGKAPEKISKLYGDAVYYKKKGDVKRASISIGLLAHYYGDINNPLHTDQCKLEEKVHSKYENAVNTRTNSKGENEGWIIADGYVRVTNITTETVGAATLAHGDYVALVNGYAKHGYDKTVEAITKRSLNRAVNDLADIIVSVGVEGGRR